MNDAIQPLRAGVVGLGMIGGGVAVSLVRSGLVPAVYDVRPDAADALSGAPAQVSSPANAAKASDVILLAVVNAEQARDALIGEQGLLAGSHPGQVIALLSTISVDDVRELAALCEAKGVDLLDAGVTGGTRSAENGLVVMVGGADAPVSKAMPILKAFAKTVVHCGPQGAGMVTKLARNAITYGQWAVIHEAAGFASAGGVELGSLLEVMVEGDDEGTDHLNLLRGLVAGMTASPERIASADYLAEKDLDAAQQFAASVGVPTPITDQVRPAMHSVYSRQLPDGRPSIKSEA
ncbi:NAD(P)-dependent oxidoreductase [Paenarthrobacter sp. NPDC058040]|uniref:NAD(P)-dependent oxidoreductase n=1 Tax=unclassified Paenarthrobacter TaxID=2634190 RepID=UPI0036D7A845